MTLSVIIAAVNDPELDNTVASIRQTAGAVEIVVIDDCSSSRIRLEDPTVRLFHNQLRCGVGPSRHLGVMRATGDVILICDAHMRFPSGWLTVAMSRFAQGAHAQTVYCAVCAGLNADAMDLARPSQVYTGATINLDGRDRGDAAKHQVLEPVWLPPNVTPEDDGEICCCMGAAYFMRRDWFLRLAALPHLRIWGGDELQLSIKSWLAGGDVRLLRAVAIGHIFALKDAKPRFTAPRGVVIRNKLFSIETLLPGALRVRLRDSLKNHAGSEWSDGQAILRTDWPIVERERLENSALFVRDFEWLAERFGLV